MPDWVHTRLSDLIDIKHGYAFKGEHFHEEPPGDFLLTPGNFAIGGGFQWSKRKYYRDGPVPKEFVLRPGDLLVTMTDLSKEADTLGYSAVVPESDFRLLHNQRLGKVIKRSKSIDLGYLHWLLRSPDYRNEILASYTGSTVKHTSPKKILAHQFLRPPLQEQQRVATVLDSLEHKIELNGRMNETLEAMARAIFKDWFVDFGPTRAKAEGRAPYLAPELWDLFPGDFDYEGKPEGWSFARLTAFAEINPESWSSKNAPEELKYVDLANTKWGTIETTQRFRWVDAPSRAKRILRPGDTIVGMVRPGNGSFAFIGDSGLTGSTGFAVLRPGQSRYTALVFLAATAPENIERLTNLADGAAYPAVRPEIVGATEVVFGNDAVATRFSTLVSPILDHMEFNKRENCTLAQTRDLLLPKLMSGEIRLREAVKVVEAVA